MNYLQTIQLVLTLLEPLTRLTGNKLDDAAVAAIKAAVANLEKTLETPVTKAQLELLRLKTEW